jgi:hypothetical protein
MAQLRPVMTAFTVACFERAITGDRTQTTTPRPALTSTPSQPEPSTWSFAWYPQASDLRPAVAVS